MWVWHSKISRSTHVNFLRTRTGLIHSASMVSAASALQGALQYICAIGLHTFNATKRDSFFGAFWACSKPCLKHDFSKFCQPWIWDPWILPTSSRRNSPTIRKSFEFECNAFYIKPVPILLRWTAYTEYSYALKLVICTCNYLIGSWTAASSQVHLSSHP